MFRRDSHNLDAIMTGDGDTLVEVYRPKWWRIDRWIGWLLVPASDRRYIEIVLRDGEGKPRFYGLRAKVVRHGSADRRVRHRD